MLSAHGGGGKERHFSYYAHADLTGTKRWSQRSEMRSTAYSISIEVIMFT